jgi:hypothetical protein
MKRPLTPSLGFAAIALPCVLIVLWATLFGSSDSGKPTGGPVAAPALADPDGGQPPQDLQETKPPKARPSLPEKTLPYERRFISEEGIAAAKQVDALPGELGPDIVAELRLILNDSSEGELLRNNVANRLRQCDEQGLAADLTRMVWDEHETPKWRNYCVQHLYTCYEKVGDGAILGTLFRAADPAQTDEKMVRICAIWSLARAATPQGEQRMPDEKTLGEIRATALDALREKDAHFLIATAGVQSCARLGLREALPDIRKLASDDATKPAHLRVVSIAALGDLGDGSDLTLLDRFGKSATGQLKPAAALAAKKVRARAAQPEADAGKGDTSPAEVPEDAAELRDF